MTNEEMMKRTDLWQAFREIVMMTEEGCQPENSLVLEYLEAKKNGKA